MLLFVQVSLLFKTLLKVTFSYIDYHIGILNHEFLYHEVLRGGDLNVDSPHFEKNFEAFCDLAFRHPEEPESDEEANVQAAKEKIRAFIKRENREPLRGGCLHFPKYVYEAADNWHGNHELELPRSACLPRETRENECQKVMMDTRMKRYAVPKRKASFKIVCT
jgi:hypothetical protein